MKTAEEYLRSHPFILGETEDGEDYLSTDDIELIKQLAPMFEEYAESYHKERVNRVTDEEIYEWAGYCAANTTDDHNKRIVYQAALVLGTTWLKSKLMEE